MVKSDKDIRAFILSHLLLRHSVMLDNVCTLEATRVGSSCTKARRAKDFPHMELSVTEPTTGESLREAMGAEEYEKWLVSTLKNNGKTKHLVIKECLELRLNNDGSYKLKLHPELDMQLNPFATGKEKRGAKRKVCFSIFTSLLILAGVYYAFTLGYFDSLLTSESTVVDVQVNKPVLPELQAFAPDTTLIEKDTLTVEQPDSIKTDSTEQAKPISLEEIRRKVDPIYPIPEHGIPTGDERGFVAQIPDNYYIVVGSFPYMSHAEKDAKRLMRLYPELKILTTRKLDGKYINFIFTSTSRPEAHGVIAGVQPLYGNIIGMWVYKMSD